MDDMGYNTSVFVEFLEVLIVEFDSRFSDFTKFHLAFKFLKNPFIFDTNEIQKLSELFNTKKTHLEYDTSLIKEETSVPNETNNELWERLLSNCDFFVLKNILQKFLSMFGSTYLCESTFSSLTRRKNKYRSSLTQEHLESEIRCEISKFKPNLIELAQSMDCQTSH